MLCSVIIKIRFKPKFINLFVVVVGNIILDIENLRKNNNLYFQIISVHRRIIHVKSPTKYKILKYIAITRERRNL